MICDTLQQLRRYRGLRTNLDTAIDFLLTHDLAALPLGRTEVDGDKVFINLMDATLHPGRRATTRNTTGFYADLQIDLTGSEGWGCTNLPARRWELYWGLRLSGQCQRSDRCTGRRVDSYCSSRRQLHKPGLVQHGCVSVRKAVVKIRMEE